MAFCITLGTHEFESRMQGYENVRAYCRNCEHWDAYCVTRWPWFTVCFVPVLPLSIHKFNEVTCARCQYTENISRRPDIQPGQPQPPGPPGPPDPSKQQYYPVQQPPPIMAAGGIQNQNPSPHPQPQPQQQQGGGSYATYG